LQKTTAPASTFGPTAYDHFLFTDRFVSAVLVKIADIVVQPDENAVQNRTCYVFDFKSLTPITDRVSVISGAGYAAGVPDRAAATAHGWDYDKICRDDFGESDGAFIAYYYGRDQVGALIVNGTELPSNNASDRVDAGTLLTVGQNTLTIRLNSTLYGRTYFEHSGYQDRGAVYGMGEGVLDQPVSGTYYNGLLGVSIIPYIAKAKDDPDAIRDVPVTDSRTDSSTDPIYNLQGQRLGTPQRGVNIVGGKKIVVK
jgi:hypothetical protein